MRIPALAAAAILLAPAVAAADTVVLLADPWCPHTCAAGSGPAGYMVDIAREALATPGHTVIYKNTAWARAMKEVKSGKADGAVGSLREEGRAAQLVVPAEPLGRQVNAFVVRADDPWVLNGLGSLKGRVVATILDYSYSPDIDGWLAARHTTVEPLGGENALERNLKKLLQRRSDVVVDDLAVLQRKMTSGAVAGVRVAGTLPGGDLFVALTPVGGRGERLGKALDQGVATLRASGRLKQILAAYDVKDWK
ncbi:MAG: transporter substrate-binding domain-containing protein [Magnetospirillum sp.]|nr:transporter substrate-binding domain-containing protein [Magnetospirillum sp.]